MLDDNELEILRASNFSLLKMTHNKTADMNRHGWFRKIIIYLTVPVGYGYDYC